MNVIETTNVPIKIWNDFVPEVEVSAQEQLYNLASMPFIYKHLAVMPDVHAGHGSTIGSVIATQGAIIPAAVGVDIGCGMMAVMTGLKASHLPDNLASLRSRIEAAVPHGRTCDASGKYSPTTDKGLRLSQEPFESPFLDKIQDVIEASGNDKRIVQSAKTIHKQVGTLGTGNHFIEICLDENQMVWIMLHSGSRGIGNAIGSAYIEKAKKDMERWFINLPDKDLAYIPDGSELFGSYMHAIEWAQGFAEFNRKVMMTCVIKALNDELWPLHTAGKYMAVECHHNFVQRENHFGKNVLVTRKGAVQARKDMLGIIPGSMGAKSYIVRGLGNKDSFESCSHGAGRVMSRTKAKKEISMEQHLAATKGVECRHDADVLDESPAAYKDIDMVMKSQEDLVEIVHTLKQILCVKG